MLNKMTTTRVKPACPAANEIIDGATPDTSTARGKSTHKTTDWSPIPMMMAEPTRKPTVVPPNGAKGGGAGAQGIGP